MKTQKQRVLELLQTGKPVPRGALVNISFRFNARIQELRIDGHCIECVKTDDRWYYTLKEEHGTATNHAGTGDTHLAPAL